MMNGCFITFEGTEGSGKTTIIKKIEAYYKARGFKVIATREPGGSEIAEQIRNVILDVKNLKMDAVTEAMLYAASRRQHLIDVIIPYLKQGYIVFCDRFIDSSLAYQGWGRGLGIDKVYQMNLLATDGILPDLTVYIDVDPQVGIKRIKENKRAEDRLDLEDLAFHQKVYSGYREVAKRFKDRFVTVEGNRTADAVYLDVLKIIDEYIGR